MTREAREQMATDMQGRIEATGYACSACGAEWDGLPITFNCCDKQQIDTITRLRLSNAEQDLLYRILRDYITSQQK